jgi:hypothetical protein
LKDPEGKLLDGLMEFDGDSDGSRLVVSGFGVGGRSYFTKEGRTISVELSEEGVAKLTKARHGVHRAFDAAAEHLSKLGLEKAKRTSGG